MIEFDPVSATVGGVLIGLAAVLLLALSGRVAGVSGILFGVFTRQSAERNWRLLFVAGLVLGGFIIQLLTDLPLITRTDFPLPLLILAGLLVGIGTRMGSGCTSGHGVCGISRLSTRSVLATITFMLFGMMTTTVIRVYLTS